MNRRQLFLSLAALAIPAPAVADDLPPREFHRFNRGMDRWERIDPKGMKKGDVVWVHDPGGEFNEVLLVSDADPKDNFFYASHRIDKATNQWV